MTNEILLEYAMRQTAYAYAPYSGFYVGAALLTKDGTVYCGNNVENASFGAGICAERNAIFQAISKGVKEFEAIAVVGGRERTAQGITKTDYCYPCGICLQVMEEFCEDDFRVILMKGDNPNSGDIKEFRLKELLPYGFKL